MILRIYFILSEGVYVCIYIQTYIFQNDSIIMLYYFIYKRIHHIFIKSYGYYYLQTNLGTKRDELKNVYLTT